MSRSLLKILLPVLVLIVGAGATAALILSRKTPQKVEHPFLGPLVEIEKARLSSVQVTVEGQGEVGAKVSVELAPQVSGRVVEVHPNLVSGGRLRAGAVILRLEARDYELAVERARAAVASAETQLERESAEGEAATAEWRDLHGDEPAPSLLARLPQIRAAEAQVSAAEAELATAELQLDRTRLSLPFAVLVIDEAVDVGDLVMSGQRLATLYGTAAVEIRVPLDDAELAWLNLASLGRNGPIATVRADFAGATHLWEGRVDRLEGQVDPRSRMVHLVVVVADPFTSEEGHPPLLPGSFVAIEIAGRQLDEVVILPRHALREGDTVWVAEDGVLAIRQVEVLRRDRLQVYLRSGLEAGESVIVSSLDTVTDGMTVRAAGGGQDV